VEQLEDNMENKPPRSSIIDLDLRRMDLKLDEEKSRRVGTEVKRLLEVFELYRPDIRYVQGMSYLAWILLIRLNPYCSFVCFANLVLNDSFVHALYMFDEPKIRRVVSYFDECLADKRPKLHRHLHASGVDSELFLIEWAYTLYSRAFSLRIVSYLTPDLAKSGICGSARAITLSSRWR
jgi:TBC1 domain family member 14